MRLPICMRAAFLHNYHLGARPSLAARTSSHCRSLSRMVGNDQGVLYEVQKSDSQWMQELTDEQFEVLRRKGTEHAGAGEYNTFSPAEGHFVCAGCSLPIYSAQAPYSPVWLADFAN